MGAANLAWLWQALFFALIASAVLVSLWALFWDRSRGRKRCPRCWYDMSGAALAQHEGRDCWTCSECGKRTLSPRGLVRTRRRWRWVLVGAPLLLLGAYAALAVPRAVSAGPIGLVPTSWLIWWVGRYEPPEKYDSTAQTMSTPTAQAAELARRVGVAEPWGWQYRWMIYSLRLVRYRETWPQDQEYQLITGTPSWMPTTVEFKAASPLAAGTPHHDNVLIPWSVGVLPPGPSVVPLDVTLGHWTGRLDLHVQTVASAQDVLVPVTDPTLDNRMKQSLKCGVRYDPNPSTQTDYMIGARLYRKVGPIPDDLAAGLVIELLHEGQVKLTWTATLTDSPYGEPVDWRRISAPEPAWNVAADPTLAGWTMRVRGDAAASLIDTQRTKYWAGQFELPLRSVFTAP